MPSALETTRRHFLGRCPLGLGGLALASFDSRRANAAAVSALQNHVPPRTARARNVIFLHLAGSPPHLDLFDYKPELVRRTGEACPDEFYQGKQFAFTSARPTLLGTPRKFRQHGQSGLWMSDAIPRLARLADELCVVRSMHTDQFNHAPAQMMLYTGSPRMGRPSLGSWVTYGLGSDNRNLPGFVVLVSGGTNPSAGQERLGKWVFAVGISRRAMSQSWRPRIIRFRSAGHRPVAAPQDVGCAA